MKDSERNLQGQKHEKNKEIEKAVECYEMNVQLKSEILFPYIRLALIYKATKDVVNELRVLKLSLTIYDEKIKTGHIRQTSKLIPLAEKVRQRIKVIS